MNGLFVGQWHRSQTGKDSLLYASDWIDAKEGRPLSLSLPFSRGHSGKGGLALRGSAVAAYFENLIPDNEQILRRLRQRYGARSTAAFDMLAVLGRDCAGAIQLMPEGENPDDFRRIDAEPLDEAGVAKVLRETTSLDRFGAGSDEFRISIAGAQEKTALLRHQGHWCRPQRATSSMHIFKLPLGMIANVQADLRDSVELEWLCMGLLGEFGLPVANVGIGQFEDQKALIVERFDRRLDAGGAWWLRIPQEDFCQASGTPPSRKYETDGGPGMRRIMEILRGSERAAADRMTFFKAQLLFWVMAATDGHAKNFSLAVGAGGSYRLTPLYVVLSIYPIMGRGANRLDPRKAKLAMAVDGENRHYGLHEIHRWHWVKMAQSLGLEADAAQLIAEIIRLTPEAIDKLGQRLPNGFPARLFDAVRRGMLDATQRLKREPDERNQVGPRTMPKIAR